MNRLSIAASTLALLMTACASAPPTALPVARDDMKGVQSQLVDYIDHEMKRLRLAGISIALVDDQALLWARGFGWADVAAKVPASADTRYRVGSISKLFTDTAAMQLVASGRLALDEPVDKTLPWFRIGSAWPDSRPLTLRQLMTHHAGLPRDVAANMWLKVPPPPEVDFRAMLRSLADLQADAPPERVMSYSNVGLDVVGAMVEAASGQPFEQEVRDAVLVPLGMASAQFSAAMLTDSSMAHGHMKGEARDEPALRDVPAGGLNASVTDLSRFLMMQFAGGRNRDGQEVLPRDQLKAMFERQYPDLPLDLDLRTGLGWMLTTFGTDTVHGGGLVAHHSGATMYFRSQLMVLPEQKLGVVVASNDAASGEVVNRLAQRALALLLEARRGVRQAAVAPGFKPSPQPWTEAQRRSVVEACAGDYVTVVGPVSLVRDGDRISARIGDRTLDMLEGQDGRFGLRYRLAGVVPIRLGPLSEMAFECVRLDGRQVLLAALDGERILVGEKLGPPTLPAGASSWVGRYRPRLAADEFGTFGADGEVIVSIAGGRLWADYRLNDAFGGARVRALLQPISATALRAVGPLADSGPVVQMETAAGEPPQFRFSGWLFDRAR